MNTKSFLLIVTTIFTLAACNNGGSKSAQSTSATNETIAEKHSGCSGCPSANSCSKNTHEQVAVANESAVTVYYYHGSRKCKTCKAVGEVAQNTVEKYFKGNPKIAFHELNIEEQANELLAKKYQMSGSGLGILRNGEYQNLTVYAFSHAVNAPDKLESKLKEEIEKGIEN